MTDEEDDCETAQPPNDWAAQLLHFWFVESSSASWFNGGPEFDSVVAARFVNWRAVLREMPTQGFICDPYTALAAVILFDQVPRNACRGDAEAFATDHLARAISRLAVAGAFDASLSVEERLFLYLPFEHSEDIADQKESVRLVSGLGNAEWTKYALDHQAMIERFGRFPHRNKVLGRVDRPDEAEEVAAGSGW